ncbi:phage major capsid protein [Limnoglobus roseus]|uniref:Phage major capsid protein n=1 Tax=Limnoglobus roseus TaxID=2598579 RepID=A0A5C1A7U5_9BACT|nr:phage major capsid protein [Limnoglobus roseus]QEL14810.1 phage major capsid protein [Limnoglobus roseus]
MTDDKVFGLINAWENFKQINDARLKDIERKGSADPLYDEHLGNIGVAIDNHKSRIDQNLSALPFQSADGEYTRAFRNYLRKGMDAALERLQEKALSVGTDSDGGYLVTPTMSARITQAVFETSPMRHLASVETISSDALDLVDDRDSAVANWTTETASVGDTSTPKLAKRSITTHELYAQPKATQKLVDDSNIDVEVWLADKIADVFARTQNIAFISGNGVGQPRGILTFAAGTNWGQIQQINSGVSAQVTADGLINLYYSLKEGYARRASFLMNRMTAQQVRLLKQVTTGQYLWQPGLAAGAPDTLLGVPTFSAPDMPTPHANSLSVALADFRSAYQIVDRQGIRILRDPFTEKPFVKFYATTRVGGDVVNSEAIKLLKLAA